MNRRNFLFGLVGIAAAFAPLIVRATSFFGRAYYPPFVRDGLLIRPKWRLWTPGERTFCILEDEFLTCQREHWALTAECEPSDETIDWGMSPFQLGYRDHAPPGAFKFQPAT